MPGEILVSLRRNDRIEDIIPYLVEVAKPGRKVVFLIAYPVEEVSLRDYWITTESTTEAVLEGRRIAERSSWETQRGLAEQRIVPAREILGGMGLRIAVHMYAGSLRRVIEDYRGRGNVRWIMMPVGIGLRIRSVFRRIHLSPWFEGPTSPPILLRRA